MNQTATNGFTRPVSIPPADPFFYGWRDVPRESGQGERGYDRVPLTEYDVLHPQEGDHIMNGPVHDVDCTYLRGVFSGRVADDPAAAVFYDVGVYWDDPILDHHSPDITVIRGAPGVRDLTGMYHVAAFGVRPALLVEVVSRSTRKTDMQEKFCQYHQAGVPLYVIVDRDRPEGPPRLIGYRNTPEGYVEFPPDDRGRLWLEPVRLWLGTRDNRVVCYDEADRELGDYAAVSRALAEAVERAEAESRRAEAESRRAEAESRRAEAETLARHAAEARVRELEEQLRRRGDG